MDSGWSVKVGKENVQDSAENDAPEFFLGTGLRCLIMPCS